MLKKSFVEQKYNDLMRHWISLTIQLIDWNLLIQK